MPNRCKSEFSIETTMAFACIASGEAAPSKPVGTNQRIRQIITKNNVIARSLLNKFISQNQ
jgi:hypothetical protein